MQIKTQSWLGVWLTCAFYA